MSDKPFTVQLDFFELRLTKTVADSLRVTAVHEVSVSEQSVIRPKPR